MEFAAALRFLDDHTNLEGAFSGRTNPLPVAGQTEGLGLEAITELMDLSGRPHEAYRVVHITGTNGKGSTTRFASAMMTTAGLSVGAFTSPNIERINERLAYNGESISDEEFGRVIGLLADLEPLMSTKPGRWDLLTAAALVWFADQGVDVAVIEVGMLGRFDSTNIVEADVAVITNIGKDHTDGAEGWQVEVCSEKAGIIKADSHVVLGSPSLGSGELRDVIDREPRRDIWVAGQDFVLTQNLPAVGGRVIDVETPHSSYEQLHVPFHGEHQGENLTTAIATVEALFGRGLDQDVVEEAVAQVELPARFEVISRDPTVVLDGAHNPDGARQAKATLDEEFARLGSWVLVFGMLVGKDPGEMLQSIDAADFDAVIVTQPNWSRAVPAVDVAEAAKALGIAVEVVADANEALSRAKAVTSGDDLVLVSGSLYVVGEVRPAARATKVD